MLQKYQRTSGDLTYTCYDVLDGQQRLTTLFLMMAVLRDLTKNDKLKANASDAIYQEEDPFANQPERIRIEFLIRDAVGDFVEQHIKATGGSDDEPSLERLSRNRTSRCPTWRRPCSTCGRGSAASPRPN